MSTDNTTTTTTTTSNGNGKAEPKAKKPRQPKPEPVSYYKDLDPTAAERVRTYAAEILAAKPTPYLTGLVKAIMDQTTQHLDPVARMGKDIRDAAATMTRGEARFLVDSYYQIQHDRIRAAEQIRSATEARQKRGQQAEPHLLLDWLNQQSATIEYQITRALDRYTDVHEVGRWAKSIVGVGPVIAAGLLAYVDMDKTTSRGQLWSFAGLAPDKVWLPGKLRPWNAKLKVLCWKIGESFVKVCNNDKAWYGQLYKQRKNYEWEANLKGDFREAALKSKRDAEAQSKRRKERRAAAAIVSGKPLEEAEAGPAAKESAAGDAISRVWNNGQIDPTVARFYLEMGLPFSETVDKTPQLAIPTVDQLNTDHEKCCAKLINKGYQPASSLYTGLPMLAPVHIHARAKRYAVKLFLAHWWETAYRDWYGEEPPEPYPIAIKGHQDRIPSNIGVVGVYQGTSTGPRPRQDWKPSQ